MKSFIALVLTFSALQSFAQVSTDKGQAELVYSKEINSGVLTITGKPAATLFRAMELVKVEVLDADSEKLVFKKSPSGLVCGYYQKNSSQKFCTVSMSDVAHGLIDL